MNNEYKKEMTILISLIFIVLAVVLLIYIHVPLLQTLGIMYAGSLISHAAKRICEVSDES